MYYHYRSTRKRYRKLKAANKKLTCTFCENVPAEKILHKTKHNMIIANRIPYDLWEHHHVTEHLMVLPIRHLHTLAEFSDEELLDHARILAEYEANGYNIYARSVDSTVRSVSHQHTHLIKLSPKFARAGFYTRKPYLHITF